MAETRNPGRVRSILGAQIVFNNRNSTLSCQVRDISSKGARLLFNDAVSIPQEFELSVPQKGKTYWARLRWRDTEGAGVEFFTPGQEPATSSRAAAMPDLVRRLAELELENATLRLKVLELTQRLEERPSSDSEKAA